MQQVPAWTRWDDEDHQEVKNVTLTDQDTNKETLQRTTVQVLPAIDYRCDNEK
jgi:hypothetical protein